MEDFMFNLSDMNVQQAKPENITDENNLGTQGGGATPPEEENENFNDNSTPDGNSVEIDETTGQIIEPEDKKTTVDENGEDGSSDEKPSQEKKSPSSDGDSSQKSTLYALAQHLKEEGVLFLDEDLKDVNNLDDLKDLIRQSNEKAKYSNLNESQRRYQEALENGVPLNEFEKIEREIQTFQNIKPEDIQGNENLRYELLAIDLMEQGIAEDKAKRIAAINVKDQNSVQDAEEALNNIMEAKRGKFETLSKSSKDQKQSTIADFKKSIFEKESLLDNKLNDITKNKLFDLITNKVDSDENGRPLNELQKWQRDNPVESSVLLNYMFLMTDKGKNMNLIKQSGTTEASKALEKRLQGLSMNSDGTLNIPDSFMASGDSKKQQSTGESNAAKSRNNFEINI